MGESADVSWSVSRSKALRGCLRAHWFAKWIKGETEEAHARLLNTLVTLDMLAGQVVDWQVNYALDALRDGQGTPEDLPYRGGEVWQRVVEKSRREAVTLRLGRRLPYGSQPLFNDFYDFPSRPEDLELRKARVVRALDGFVRSELLMKIAQTNPERWIPRRLDGEFSASAWFLGSQRVWASLDFWLDYSPKGFVVIDWKSGTYISGDESMQLATYSVFIQETKGIPRDKVLVQAAHLPDAPDYEARPVSELECESIRATIASESEFERSLVQERRAANGGTFYWADREQFPVKPQVATCSFCKFRAICPEATISSVHPPHLCFGGAA